MASGTWPLWAVCVAVCTVAASLAAPLDLDSSYLGDEDDQISTLQDIEAYLNQMKVNLSKRRGTSSDGFRSRSILELDEPDVNSYKRFSLSGFSAVRGKRRRAPDYLENEEFEDSNTEDMKEKLLDMVNYYQYLHHRRLNGSPSVPEKRQFPKGFHAVRGKRSTPTRKQDQSQQLSM